MANGKPTVRVTQPASQDNVSRQIQKGYDYTESVLTDIAKVTTDNEVVQARMGHENLNQTLESFYNHLPVVRYWGLKIVLIELGGHEFRFDKMVMYWKGKQIVKTNLRFRTVSGKFHEYIVYDIISQEFKRIDPINFNSNYIPLFDCYLDKELFPLISFWKYDFTHVDLSKVESINCFAWVCAVDVSRHYLYTTLINFVQGCTIDMRYLPSQFLVDLKYDSGKAYIRMNANEIKNARNLSLRQAERTWPFNVKGNYNSIYTSDYDSGVEFDGENNLLYRSKTNVPVGEIGYGYVLSPECLELNGQTVSTITYKDLYYFVKTNGLIGASNNYGLFYVNGNKMRIPDFRNKFIRAKAHDRTVGSYQADSFKSHRHGTSIHIYDRDADNNTNWEYEMTRGYVRTGTLNTHYSGGYETRPKNIALLAYIKH